MPGNAEIRLTTSDDRQKVMLEIVLEGKSEAYGILNPQELDALIRALGVARAGLTSPVPEQFDPVSRPPATEYPKWQGLETVPRGRTLAFRHPGYGWLIFLISPERAHDIATWLSSPEEHS